MDTAADPIAVMQSIKSELASGFQELVQVLAAELTKLMGELTSGLADIAGSIGKRGDSKATDEGSPAPDVRPGSQNLGDTILSILPREFSDFLAGLKDAFRPAMVAFDYVREIAKNKKTGGDEADAIAAESPAHVLKVIQQGACDQIREVIENCKGAANRDLRPNAELDDFFGQEEIRQQTATRIQAANRDLRPNAELDDFFGVRNKAASQEVLDAAPDQENVFRVTMNDTQKQTGRQLVKVFSNLASPAQGAAEGAGGSLVPMAGGGAGGGGAGGATGGLVGRAAGAIARVGGGLATGATGAAGAAGGGALGGAAGLAGGAGVAASAALGPAAILGIIGTVGVALASLPDKIAEFATGILEGSRALAEFSPSMAMVFAQSDLRDTQRGMALGEDTAASTQYLADAIGDLKDSTRDIRALFSNVVNGIMTLVVELVTGIASFINQIAKAVNYMLSCWPFNRGSGWDGKDDDQPIHMGQWLDQITDDVDRMRRNNDVRMRRPDFAADEAQNRR